MAVVAHQESLDSNTTFLFYFMKSPTMRSALIQAIFLLAALFGVQILNSTVNFEVCLLNFTNPTSPWHNFTGGRSIDGDNLASMAGTGAISYALCVEACGLGPAPLDWRIFSQQFSTWLALISHMPFGAGSNPENLMFGR